jgi:hypothetical protein
MSWWWGRRCGGTRGVGGVGGVGACPTLAGLPWGAGRGRCRAVFGFHSVRVSNSGIDDILARGGTHSVGLMREWVDDNIRKVVGALRRFRHRMHYSTVWFPVINAAVSHHLSSEHMVKALLVAKHGSSPRAGILFSVRTSVTSSLTGWHPHERLALRASPRSEAGASPGRADTVHATIGIIGTHRR